MHSLTSRQRDLLRLLLAAREPLGAAELAERLGLTPRQVSYSLKGLGPWLGERDFELRVTPGVGVVLGGSEAEHRQLQVELEAEEHIEIVLDAARRRQLIALILLTADEPMILYQLQRLAGVSRTTVLRDLDEMTPWLGPNVTLERRPNYGVSVAGAEWNRRQVLAGMLWNDRSPGPAITAITYHDGLVFPLGRDARFLPLVERAQAIVQRIDLKRAFGHVAYAEAQLGGRFTDDALLYLALVLAIQADRVRQGNGVRVDADLLRQLQVSPVWGVAMQIARRLGWRAGTWPEAEIAGIAMHLLAAPRNERWPGDMEIDTLFKTLIDALMARIGAVHQQSALAQDIVLRDGLAIQIIPACMRQRYRLWMPAPAPNTTLSDHYAREHALARDLDDLIAALLNIRLPQEELNNLALLLRAAYLRTQPGHEQQVLIVCPSGMATAQLLVARLKARFPRLGTYTVLSMRELSQQHVDGADLIITTASLPERFSRATRVIHVHPLLLPEDVAAISQYLT